MTKTRAEELIAWARWESLGCLCHGSKPPKGNRVTPAERRMVSVIWETLPGTSCYMDALHRIKERSK